MATTRSADRDPANGSPGELATYQSKRRPERTPEPMGARPRKTSSSVGGSRFVVQEHHARALHWDFRLEHDGVLVSWALPKGIPVDPTTDHLAVHTEDHPLEYASFEGEIPKGEYGGGQVSIWDSGEYALEKWDESEVKVVLRGAKATGRYVLFATGGKNWLIHRMDPRPEGLDTPPDSVRPMLALAGELPRADAGWAYEFKWDGIRAIVHVDGGRVRAVSRNDKDLTRSFPELRALGERLGSRSAVLDGEIVAFGDGRLPSFGRLQRRLHLGTDKEVARRAADVPVTFLAFDALYLDGNALVDLPYDERRSRLEALDLNATTDAEGDAFSTPGSFRDARGTDVLEAARTAGLEGVVAKRRSSPYLEGRRNGDWVKVKNFRTQEVVVGGWTEGRGARSGELGALLLGVNGPEGLVYAGKVGTGFGAPERRALLALLTARRRKTSPFATALTRGESSGVQFVTPVIVGEVRYAEWTADGHLRHPSWRGLRPDKSPEEVVREQ